MKTTKLFTTLAAFVLVLGLGACDLTQDETPTSDDTSEVTSETGNEDETTDETSEGGDKGGETTELSNYTVSFTFVDQDEKATTIPEYATAYIIGAWDNWTEFIPLTNNDGVYSYTFETITSGSYEYKGVMWYTETENEVSWDNCVEIITGENGGNATLVVSASEGDNYTQEISCVLTKTLVKEGDPVTNVTLSVRFLDASTGLQTLEIPSGYSIYLAGTFNATGVGTDSEKWTESTDYPLTRDETIEDEYVYTYTFSSLNVTYYTIQFLYCATGTFDWNHSLGTITLNVGAGDTDAIKEVDHKTEYDDFNDVIKEIGSAGNTNFYVLYVDSGSLSVDDISTNIASATWATGVNSDSGSITQQSTAATATTASTGKVVVYNTGYFTASSYANVWCTLYKNSWNPQSGTNGIEVPKTDSGTYAVYIGEVTLSNFQSGSGTQNVWDNTGKWVTNVDSITTVINNLADYYTL